MDMDDMIKIISVERKRLDKSHGHEREVLRKAREAFRQTSDWLTLLKVIDNTKHVTDDFRDDVFQGFADRLLDRGRK